MGRILLRRLIQSVPTLIGVTLVSFLMVRMIPGDPVKLLLGERGTDPAVYEELSKNLGLDKSLPEQYFIFLKNAAQGDFGKSITTRRPVVEEFFDRFPATIELGVTAILIALVLGLPLGLVAAAKRGRFFDYFFMSGALVGYSMPIFWWGLILIMFFSVGLGWTPVAGRLGAFYDVEPVTGFMLIDSLLSGEGWPAFVDSLRHLILPSLALATIPMAAVARMTRSSLLEVLREDYIRTARAKGVGEHVVIVHHALKNALIPIITIIGLMVSSVLTGAILTETIFSWPGIGRWIVTSVEARDYPVIQGGVFLIATTVLAVNLLVDLLYAYVNPRLKEVKT